MRLINVKSLRLESFEGSDIPPYAILSHRWSRDEIDFKDFTRRRRKDSVGYQKIVNCCAQVNRGKFADYLWIDTACIDKRSSSELSEAINSMFRWYQDAVVCLVYLADVSTSDDLAAHTSRRRRRDMNTPKEAPTAGGSLASESHELQTGSEDFTSSDWFNRGWTLQELLAPQRSLFFSGTWDFIGHIRWPVGEDIPGHPAGSVKCLEQGVSQRTGISTDVLAGRLDLASICVAAKMGWLAERKTTRMEDIAYCSLGMFGVHMPLLYGEGMNAFIRLQEEIIRSSNDESIFAWTADESASSSAQAGNGHCFPALADHPMRFRSLPPIRLPMELNPPFLITNQGLEIRLLADNFNAWSKKTPQNAVAWELNCEELVNSEGEERFAPVVIYFRREACKHYVRVAHSLVPLIDEDYISKDMTIYVHISAATHEACQKRSGLFWRRNLHENST